MNRKGKATSHSAPRTLSPYLVTEMIVLIVLLSSCGLAIATDSCPEEWGHFQNRCYRVPIGKFSFAQAFEVCQNLTSHPVVITSDEEQGYVEDIFFRGVGRGLWTSGVRVGPGSGDSSFRWMTGQAFTYSRWAKEQPNNRDGNEYCVLLSSGPIGSGLWHDVRCEQRHAVLCQRTVKGCETDEEFGDVLKDLYSKYHPVPKSDFTLYMPFLLAFGAIASMFTMMAIIFFGIIKFLSSTSLDEEGAVRINNNLNPKADKNGVVNKGYV